MVSTSQSDSTSRNAHPFTQVSEKSFKIYKRS